MAGLIDTNLLLYAANTEAPEHGKSYNFLIDLGWVSCVITNE